MLKICHVHFKNYCRKCLTCLIHNSQAKAKKVRQRNYRSYVGGQAKVVVLKLSVDCVYP